MNKGRVIIGMSGGVDSSVSALLLKQQGYDVIGVYIVGWLGEEDFPCDWQKEESDARAVAKEIGIPFYSVNLSNEYKKSVIDVFFAEYKKGRTPNPDVLCNSEIKFRALPDSLRQLEAEYIATGHYARISNVGGVVSISEPVDKDKDQTYFLWRISKKIVPKLIFPLGELTKTEVRSIAEKHNLPTAKKKDSQGVCFVGPLKVREFLQSRLIHQPGDVRLPDGRTIARHEGAELYTIGQRLGVGSVEWTGDVPPLFVIEKDLATNTLTVGSDHETFKSCFIAVEPNWHLAIEDGSKLDLRIRYRQPLGQATVKVRKNQVIVELDEPMRAITPGQSVVFYKKGRLVGGAIIDEVL